MVTGISFSQTSNLAQLLILSFTFSFYYNYISSAQRHNPDICFNLTIPCRIAIYVMDKKVGLPSLRRAKKTHLEQVLHQVYSPLSLKSSTITISWSMCGGDLFMTLWTVRSNVDQPSLWKTMITLALGRLCGYLRSLHLKKMISKKFQLLFFVDNLSFVMKM